MDRRHFLTAAGSASLLASRALAQPQTSAPGVVIPPAGLVGELHLPDGKGRAPGLMILGGSEGGHAAAFHFAQVFAKRGFASLGLAYFGDPGVPATMEDVPLEYFTRGLDWLAAQPGVDPKRLGIFGG